MKITIAFLLFTILFSGQAISAEANPNITDAPNRGELPGISPYRHTVPDLYSFENIPVEQIAPGMSRQVIYGSQTTLARWVFAKDTVVHLHNHVSEQVTWIVSGSVEVFSQGKRYVVRAGEVIVIPPNVPHEFHTLEDNTVDVDFFTPARQDWMDGTANYLKSK